MKKYILIISVCFLVLSSVSYGAPTVVWTVEKSIQTPESAYFDKVSKTIFVSNIAGEAMNKDGLGWISKYKKNGQVISEKWIEGLNAPKGMRSHHGSLWVTDIDDVVEIDIKKGKIINRFHIEGSKFLNDIAINRDGIVYVSDMLLSKIYQIQNGKPSIFMEGNDLEAPNGLLVKNKFLYVAAWGIPNPDFSTKIPGHLFKINLVTKEKTLITKQPLGNLDGLEMNGKGNFLVSDWMAGKVFEVTPDGKSKEILSGIKNSADIGYIQKGKLLVVPSMSGNQVIAYSLK